jgi:hypothetical protein
MTDSRTQIRQNHGAPVGGQSQPGLLSFRRAMDENFRVLMPGMSVSACVRTLRKPREQWWVCRSKGRLQPGSRESGLETASSPFLSKANGSTFEVGHRL